MNTPRLRLPVLRLILLIGAAASAQTSQAQFGFLYEWNKPGGGAYGATANWTPSGVPNASNEAARFSLDATYGVTLPQSNVTVSSLDVAQGDVVLSFAKPPAGMPLYTYTSNGALTIGSTGRGSLGFGSVSATQEARLNTGAAMFGVTAGSEGSLVIGIGAAWNSGHAIIGGAGSGTLVLERLAGATTASAVLGQSTTGSGTANLTGYWSSGDLIVGDAGSANLGLLQDFSDGFIWLGMLDSDMASIAAQPGSTGTVNVTGNMFIEFSEWHIAESLTIGGVIDSPGGVGRLLIGNGNYVTVGDDLRIWSGGTLALRENGVFSIAGAVNLGGALEFSLIQTPSPLLGDEFEILTGGSVIGTFASMSLPPLADGLRWVVDYKPTSALLRVASAFSADFDEDGDVDAGDLAQWKGDFGVNAFSNADNDGDSDGHDFLTWQRQVGSGQAAAVPEPSGMLLCAVGVVGAAIAPGRRHR